MKYNLNDLAWAKGTSEPVRVALYALHQKCNQQDELLRQALDALIVIRFCVPPAQRKIVNDAIAAIKEALNDQH